MRDAFSIQVEPVAFTDVSAAARLPAIDPPVSPGLSGERDPQRRSGTIVFLMRRAGEGSYWRDGDFSAALFEDVEIRLEWNPLAALLRLRGRTRRFYHPVPPLNSTTAIITNLSLLDASGREVAAPVRVDLLRGQSDQVSDTGLMSFNLSMNLELSGVDLSVVAKIKLLGETLEPI